MYTPQLPSNHFALTTTSDLMLTSAPPPPHYSPSSFPPASPSEDLAFLDEQFGDEQESASSGPPRTKRGDKHIRRPANPFILFACDYRRKQANRTRNNRHLSKEAGLLWRLMPEPEKKQWIRRANVVKEEHSVKHPDYRYKPRRRDAARLSPCSDAPPDDSGVYFFHSSPSHSPSAGSARSLHGKTNSNEAPTAAAPSARTPFPWGSEHVTHLHGSAPEETVDTYEDEFNDGVFRSRNNYCSASPSAAEPHCGISGQSSTPLETEFSHLCLSQLENDPRKIPPPHIDFNAQFSSDNFSTYTAMDQTFSSGTYYNNHPNTRSTVSEFETTPFFNSFGLSNQASVTRSANFDSTFDSFFFGSDQSYRR